MLRTRTLLLAAALAAATTPFAAPSPSPAAAADVATFHGQSPARLLDTRSGNTTIDGQFNGVGAVAGGNTLDLTVLGRGGVPAAGVGSVALNVTVTNPTATGYVTVYPTGNTRPLASNLNYNGGQTAPNMVIVAVGTGGKISLYNSTIGTADLVVDVLGWFPAAGAFNGVLPARVLDTRTGASTVDGASAGVGAIAPNSPLTLQIAGRGGVPSAGAGSVALNVTVTDPTVAGYLTVHPAGSPRPVASNLNFTPGQTVPNMVIVPLGANGQITLFNGSGGTAHVVVDVLGSFPTGASFSGANPARLLDTRGAQVSVDGRFAGNGALEFGETFNVVVAGRGGVPSSGAGAVALNVTATNATGNGYLTVFPAGTSRPQASNLNFTVGGTRPNMVLVPLGRTGQISIYNSAGDTDVIVDVLGWFPYPTDPPVLLGNDFTLGAHSFGSMTFGAAPANVVVPTVSAVLGAPTLDEGDSFPTPSAGGNGLYSNDEFEFAFKRGRQVCWGFTLCLYFGADTDSPTMPLRGYAYFHDFRTPTTDGVSLFDVRGLGLGARGSDFPGAVIIPTGGCQDFGLGHTPEGIDLTLRSSGIPFTTFDGPGGSAVDHTPRQDEVTVQGFSAGDIYLGSGDC